MLPYTATRGCLAVYTSGYCWLFAATIDIAIEYVKHMHPCKLFLHLHAYDFGSRWCTCYRTEGLQAVVQQSIVCPTG